MERNVELTMSDNKAKTLGGEWKIISQVTFVCNYFYSKMYSVHCTLCNDI